MARVEKRSAVDSQNGRSRGPEGPELKEGGGLLSETEVRAVFEAQFPAVRAAFARVFEDRHHAAAAAAMVAWLFETRLPEFRFRAAFCVLVWVSRTARRVRKEYRRLASRSVQADRRVARFDWELGENVGDGDGDPARNAEICGGSAADLGFREPELGWTAEEVLVAAVTGAEVSGEIRDAFALLPDRDRERLLRAAAREDETPISNAERQANFKARRRAKAVLAEHGIYSMADVILGEAALVGMDREPKRASSAVGLAARSFMSVPPCSAVDCTTACATSVQIPAKASDDPASSAGLGFLLLAVGFLFGLVAREWTRTLAQRRAPTPTPAFRILERRQGPATTPTGDVDDFARIVAQFVEWGRPQRREGGLRAENTEVPEVAANAPCWICGRPLHEGRHDH